MKENSWNQFKSVFKKNIPRYWLDALGKYRYRHKKSDFEGKIIEQIFKEIYSRNYWRNTESVSGPGSTISTTQGIRSELEKLFSLFHIHSLIDAPCGDFNWMRKVGLGQIDYLGLDIVPEIIETNTRNYSGVSVHFDIADITKDHIPKADIIISRDCLVHFSFEDIFKTLNNFKNSGSTYLLTTSFAVPKLNYNITTGDWRPVNLLLPPFNFGPSLYQIADHFKGPLAGDDLGKILGLWKLNELKIKG